MNSLKLIFGSILLSAATQAAAGTTAMINALATHAGETTIESVTSADVPQLQLSVGTDASAAFLRWGRSIDGPMDGIVEAVSFTASAPLRKGEDFTVLRDLDGFASGFSFEFKYSDFRALGASRQAAVATLTSMTASTDARALRASVEAAVSEAWIVVWGATAKVGYEEFDYLEEITLKERRKKKTPYGGSVFGGVLLSDHTLLAARFEYQEAHESAAKKSFAGAPDANGLQEVTTGAYGAPTRDAKRLYTLELRTRLLGKGVTLRGTYDAVDDVVGVRLPIYFAEADKAGGAIEFGWTDQKRKGAETFTVAIVVGTKFGLGL